MNHIYKVFLKKIYLIKYVTLANSIWCMIGSASWTVIAFKILDVPKIFLRKQ